MPGTWTNLDEHPLTRENLRLLLDNRIAAIRIKGFATPQECAVFVAAAKQVQLKYYSVGKIGYIGLAQYEYRWDRPKEDYFHDAFQADEDIALVYKNSFNPVQRFIDQLHAVWQAPVEIAREEKGKYYAGIVRSTTERIDLHVDWAPVNSPTYDIGAIDGQLGWNFFAEELLEGGHTTVHNAPWDPEVTPGEIPKSYGLDRTLVEGAKKIQYRPTAGDVVLFNSRNPHEIMSGTTEPGRSRMSIGSFVGRMPSGKLVLWS
ncbi:MAG: hypothetical protein V4718_10450 [Pseudomonadota bacterium]